MFLLFVMLFALNSFFKVTIDYNLIENREIKATFLDYYFNYLKFHSDRKMISVKKTDINSITINYKDGSFFKKIEYNVGKNGFLYNKVIFKGNKNYELSSFQRLVFYCDNYIVFLYDPICSNQYVYGQIYYHEIDNVYGVCYFKLNEPIKIYEAEKFDINSMIKNNLMFTGNSKLIFDTFNNQFYETNNICSFQKLKNEYSIQKNDLNNASSIYSPFFEPNGEEFFRVIH